MSIRVEIGPGELIDRITILRIKSERIEGEEALGHIRAELEMLLEAFERDIRGNEELERLTAELKEINEKLWDTENEIRECERDGDFGSRFIELARSVYKTNDLRAAVKRRIDEMLSSRITDIKSYERY